MQYFKVYYIILFHDSHFAMLLFIVHISTYISKNLFSILGWWGLGLITFFCINAAFSGTRLGLCWVILEQRYEEFRKEIRDPYPSIGEKAVGKWGR